LLSALISVSVDGDGLTHDELLAMGFLLITAGYETTVNLIGNGTLALLRNPAQLAKVRADPGTIAATVEEMLRFDGPVNIATPRFTTAEIDVDGVVIPPHEQVFLSLLSANRDVARFPEADRFDVERNTRGHLAFRSWDPLLRRRASGPDGGCHGHWPSPRPVWPPGPR
jgi:cytochrome P450